MIRYIFPLNPIGPTFNTLKVDFPKVQVNGSGPARFSGFFVSAISFSISGRIPSWKNGPQALQTFDIDEQFATGRQPTDSVQSLTGQQ
jgi:hypothetical protein